MTERSSRAARDGRGAVEAASSTEAARHTESPRAQGFGASLHRLDSAKADDDEQLLVKGRGFKRCWCDSSAPAEGLQVFDCGVNLQQYVWRHRRCDIPLLWPQPQVPELADRRHRRSSTRGKSRSEGSAGDLRRCLADKFKVQCLICRLPP
jgi:hypothetical protein